MIALPVAGAGGAVVTAASDQTPDRPRVSPDVQAALPVDGAPLHESLCPGGLGLSRVERAKLRRKGRRELRALTRAFRRDPEAVAIVTSHSSDVAGGPFKDPYTVRELVERHARLAAEAAPEDRSCTARAQRALEAMLRHG